MFTAKYYGDVTASKNMLQDFENLPLPYEKNQFEYHKFITVTDMLINYSHDFHSHFIALILYSSYSNMEHHFVLTEFSGVGYI